MEIFINGQRIPTDKGVVLVFENDEERILVGTHLLNYEPIPDKPRKYGIFPENLSDEEKASQMRSAVFGGN